ncbi:MAG: hypothetical protein QOF01_961 [Thermomicrobiales bacterium]|nr:hypothetical protein [Thermomicrobiales bacterium]
MRAISAGRSKRLFQGPYKSARAACARNLAVTATGRSCGIEAPAKDRHPKEHHPRDRSGQSGTANGGPIPAGSRRIDSGSAQSNWLHVEWSGEMGGSGGGCPRSAHSGRGDSARGRRGLMHRVARAAARLFRGRFGAIFGWNGLWAVWYNQRWRGVRVVDGAALEKRSGDEPAWVRIPPSPPGDGKSPVRALGRVA